MPASVVNLAPMLSRVSPWASEWCRALQRRGHSPRTTHCYVSHIARLEAHLTKRGILNPPMAGTDHGGRPVGVGVATASHLMLEGWRMDKARWNFQMLIDFLDTVSTLNPRTISVHFTSVTQYVRHLERHHGFPHIDTEAFWEEELRNITRKIKKLRARRANSPPTLEELRNAVALEPSLRNRALLLLIAKTGARKEEVLSLDWSDVDLRLGTLKFKSDGQHFKRTSFDGLIDAETCLALRLWRVEWATQARRGEDALFVSMNAKNAGGRLGRQAALVVVTNAFARLEKRYNVHSLRHWFSDTLRSRGMADHMIAYLRGDAPATTLDLYTHLTSEQGRAQLRASYDRAMPGLTTGRSTRAVGKRRNS